MAIDNLQDVKVGDVISASWLNAIKNAAAIKKWSNLGFYNGTGVVADTQYERPIWFGIEASIIEDVSEYKILGIGGNIDFADEYVEGAKVYQYGSPLQYFTTDDVGIDYVTNGVNQGNVKPIPFNRAILLTVKSGEDIKPGHMCGPEEDGYEIVAHGTGLMCLTNPDSTTNLAWFIRSAEPHSIIGEVFEDVPGFTPPSSGNDGVLGRGRIKLKYRNSDDELIDAPDPSTGVSPWYFPVFNMAGDITYDADADPAYLRFVNELGIGLVHMQEGLIPFILKERVESLDDFPKEAYILGSSGATEAIIEVEVDPVITHQYGPGDIGFKGWCIQKDGKYVIVHMQRFARTIYFYGEFFGTCIADAATVLEYYDGEDPSVWNVKLVAKGVDCTCLKTELGIAHFDDKESEYPDLYYNVIHYDQMTKATDVGDCFTGSTCIEGSALRNLVLMEGLEYEEGECTSVGCKGTLRTDGLKVIDAGCSESPGEINYCRELEFLPPFYLANVETCEKYKKAQVWLSPNFITSDCLEIAGGGCSYNIEIPQDMLTSDCDCITVEQQTVFDPELGEDVPTCGWNIACDPECFTPDLEAGTCIDITDNVISNTMTITAGTGIAVTGDDCNKVISYLGSGGVGLEAGDCIELTDNGSGGVSINNTFNVIGGNGIIVQETPDGCTKAISLDGGNAYPKTTIKFICDIQLTQTPITIDCVSDGSGGFAIEASGGDITVTPIYSSFDIPTSLITNASDGCGSGSSGGSGGNGLDPDPPDGDGIDIEYIDCTNSPYPHFQYTIYDVPEGCVWFEIEITGSTIGTFTVLWRVDAHELGSPYWGPLVDGYFGDVPAGEDYTFTITYMDENQNTISTDSPIEMSCP